MVDPRVPSFRQVIDLYYEGFHFSENHVNSKHQNANFKQIPMTQIQKSKPDQPEVMPAGIINGRHWLVRDTVPLR